MLRQGNDLQVIDAASGEDITRLILTQIIVEDAKTPESSLPLDLLRQMVVASGRASQESALKYMKAMADLYQNTYRAMPSPLNPFDLMQNLRVNQETPEDKIPPAASEPPRKGSSNDKKQPDIEEMRDLKRRLAELEKHVSTIVPPKSRRKRK